MTGVLLLAALLRVQGFAAMQDMTHYDEAYYGVDALSLLQAPRLTPFFPENFGRESLFMYWLAPALAIFGGGAFALRLTALLTGILTIAAVYRLGRELWGREVGVWAALALAVLFWHILAGHQAFRAHLYPLIGALAFTALFHARRRQRMGGWLIAGSLFGLLAYTYIAARAWLALAAGLALLWAWRTPSIRRGLLLAGTLAAGIALPLVGYLFANQQLAAQRGEQVSISTIAQLLDNLLLWANAWLGRGAADVAYNLPERPILDVPLGVLLLTGGVLALSQARKHRLLSVRFLFLLLLAAASLAPALLTIDPLKPLRAVGVVVPLALLLGMAAQALWRSLAGGRLGRVAAVAPLVLLLWAGANSSRDFARWVTSPDLYLPMEQHLNRAIDQMANGLPAASVVYFSPFTPSHPVIRLRAGDLAPRRVSAFQSGECLRLTTTGDAYYFALTLFDGGFAERLAPYADVTLWSQEAGDTPRYTLYQAQPRSQFWETPAAAVFADRLAVSLIGQLAAEARAGDTFALTLAFAALQPLSAQYTLFVHLYGDPTPYEGGALWAQGDTPLCLSSPPQTWRSDERIVQTVTLTLPSDVPASEYELAIGIYDTLTQERLLAADGLSYAIAAPLTLLSSSSG
jgi:4-amino-4-deoxy-L-arabinose transferase-like glycosyltransferase